MLDHVDEKGKIFTERVRKNHVEVEILTTHSRVHGYVHVAPEQRVKDLLNIGQEQFLAVTGATVWMNNGGEPQHIDFMALNKQYIVSVVPINEPKSSHAEDERYPY